jgi:hypothetical protein
MPKSTQRKQFLDALSQLGGSAGNGSLREQLGWDEHLYAQVRAALVEEGVVTAGRGRGGSVHMVSPAPAEPQLSAAERPAVVTQPRAAKSSRAEKRDGNAASATRSMGVKQA